MKLDRAPVTVTLLLAVAAAAQLFHYYPRLPETIATHFGPSGRADGWSSKPTFFVVFAIIEAAIALGGLAMARLGERVPAALLNIPNKDHWLSAERREESLSFFWTQTVWIEAATLAFLIVVAEFVFRANLAAGPPRLASDFTLVLIAFVAAVIYQSIRIVRRFSRLRP